VGGGVALFAVQFAVALGAKVFCTSGSYEKIANTAAMGVAGGANYRNEDWDKQLLEQSGGFDLIIDGAGGGQMNTLLALCKPGGTIVCYGATLGAADNLNLHRIFWKQIRLQGTTMGTDDDFADMLRFVEKHRIVPVIDSEFLLQNTADAFRLMEHGGQFGKIVVKINEQ
jgi:NADPH:quinone reductase-like Zn-dependent oxidoreductase